VPWQGRQAWRALPPLASRPSELQELPAEEYPQMVPLIWEQALRHVPGGLRR